MLMLAAGLVSCAAPPPAPPPSETPPAVEVPVDGWVELRLLDRKVPADPLAAMAGDGVAPPLCELEVLLDGAPMVETTVKPAGASPPYSVDKTVRFSTPPGVHGTTIYYSSCRNYGDRPDSLEVAMRIRVRAGWITRLRFDGSTLYTDPPVPR